MLWRQYNKAKSPEEKFEIKKKIDVITIEIKACSNKLKICKRFMWRRGILRKEAIKVNDLKVFKDKIYTEKEAVLK